MEKTYLALFIASLVLLILSIVFAIIINKKTKEAFNKCEKKHKEVAQENQKMKNENEDLSKKLEVQYKVVDDYREEKFSAFKDLDEARAKIEKIQHENTQLEIEIENLKNNISLKDQLISEQQQTLNEQLTSFNNQLNEASKEYESKIEKLEDNINRLSVVDLDKRSREDLLKICKDKGITGVSRKNKKELIQVISERN